MLGSKGNPAVRDIILGFDKRIEETHLAFQRYRAEEGQRIPDWESLEREILLFSRRKIIDVELSLHLERVMYKFQNRKRIWLNWAEELHRTP